MSDDLCPFLAHLDSLPLGYSEGRFAERRYKLTVHRSDDGKRWWLFGEELGGRDRVSCNVYRLGGSRARILPCEMPLEKVVFFVAGFVPDGDASRKETPPR